MEAAAGQPRIQSVDALRGAIIILMALDHVRDFTSVAAMSFAPTDLSRTTVALFLRVGSHISARRCSRSPRASARFSGISEAARSHNSRASC